jgi:tRNA uridine 5-carboxymethylaminomethyl modification enzyme
VTPAGRELGIVDDARWRLFERKRAAVDAEASRLKSAWIRPGTEAAARAEPLLDAPLTREQRAFDLLRRPEVDYAELTALIGAPQGDWLDDERLAAQVPLQVDVQAKYSGYIERQADEIERQRRHEETTLPAEIDYALVRGLSHEVRQRPPRASPGDDRHRVKDSGHHARGDLAVADPPEAPRPGAAGERHGPRGRRGSLSTSNVLVRAFLRTLPASNTRPFITR